MRTRVEVRTLPPRILQHAPRVGEVAGGQVSLLCTALGVPAPLIKFKFAGDEYTGRPANDASALNTTTAVLDIRNLGLGNEGEYSCLAVNEYGHDQASTQLHVYARTQILKGPSDRVLESGDTVTMPCRVSARIKSCATAGYTVVTILLIYAWPRVGLLCICICNGERQEGRGFVFKHVCIYYTF
jgi:hypothetical protein